MIRSIVLFLFVNLVLAAGIYGQSANTYVDKKFGFSVNYATDFRVVIGTAAKSETAFGDPGRGVKLVKVTPRNIPERYHGDYEFNVWRSNTPKARCGAPAAEESMAIPLEAPEGEKTKMIGGHTFFAYTGSEGGMSKSMGLVGYRGMVGGKCWMIQSVTYQVSAFDDFKSFDGKIIDKAFEKFVESFKFLR